MKRLALGAAMGQPLASISASASGCAGIRSPTEGSPAVTMPGIEEHFGTTMVKGPGQKRSASRPAGSGQTAARERAISTDATCTITGLVGGRPFASKMRRTACSSSAFAPSP